MGGGMKGRTMERKITLSEICDDLYKKQQRRAGQMLVHPTKEQRKNFLSKNIKYLKEIIKALQLVDYIRYIKPDFDMENNGYAFSEKSREFLVCLLDNYTSDNLLELRRGHFDKVSDRGIVWIVEGIFRMFQYNNVPDEVLEQISIKLVNLTNYPVRLRYGKMFQMTYDLEQLAGRAFWSKYRTSLGGADNCVWLEAMEADLQSFIKKWKFIYAQMGEIRQEEVNNIAEEKMRERMTDSCSLRAAIEFELAEKINAAIENDKKLAALKNELEREIVNKKTGYYADKQEGFEYIKKRIHKRELELEQEVIRKYCGNMNVPLDKEIVLDSDFDSMKSAEDVLKEAMDEYQESLVPFSKLDLPKEDIEEIISRLKIDKILEQK